MIIAISNGLKQTETLAAVAAAAAATMVRSGNRQREKQQNAQRQGGKDYITICEGGKSTLLGDTLIQGK